MREPHELVSAIVTRLEPLERAVHLAWWNSAVSGTSADYEELARARDAYDAALADEGRFAELARWREEGVDDPLLARSIEALYLLALPRQGDPALTHRINELASEVERVFSIHRPLYNGAHCSLGDLEEVLRHERNVARRREAWEASKSVGPLLAGALAELVELRNRSARAAGYPDFYHLQVAAGEQRPEDIERFLDQIETATRPAFIAVKGRIDERLGARYGVAADEIRPWHYDDPFFQSAPDVFGADLDRVYQDVEIVPVARDFFDGIGLGVDTILERSSLFEAAGKDPHAFATDIDRGGDVRILLNLRPNARWMNTTLHELGHGVYDLGIDRALPWELRTPAHTLTTEAVAMLFGRLAHDPAWMVGVGAVETIDAHVRAASDELQATMILLARWVQVMARFERALYADPTQDLNALWWELVETYQLVPTPDRPPDAADYGAKIHVVAAPVYYHNYLYGECFASQLAARLEADVLNGRGYVGNREVGAWLTDEIFRPGARWHFDELARRSTGAAVDAAAFSREFVD